jgi:hypothetical protein
LNSADSKWANLASTLFVLKEYLMTISTIDRKHDLLERTKPVLHTKIYIPGSHNYVTGFLHEPNEVSTYLDEDFEPIVDHDGLYQIDKEQAWLTVNHYNALVLNTRNMLIADVDFGDQRLNRFAGATNCNEVLENLGELHLLDEDLATPDLSFAEQTFLVYRTHSGCRVICTSVCVPWDEWGWAAERFMRFLGGDPQYIQLCGVQKCYRARLTPKPWRCSGDSHVCSWQGTVGNKVTHPELEEQLHLHDEVTLRENNEESFLA